MAGIKIAAAANGGSAEIAGPPDSSANTVLKLPADTGSAGQVLKVKSDNHSATNAELEWAADSAGIASTHGGVAKAWISCDIDGSNGNRDSFNIAGFTDEGTGDLSITFDTDMANTTYVAILMDDITSYNTRWLSSWSGSGYGGMFTISDRAVGSCRFQNLTTGASMVNSENINIVVFGDQ